jgi:hypothetical protein
MQTLPKDYDENIINESQVPEDDDLEEDFSTDFDDDEDEDFDDDEDDEDGGIEEDVNRNPQVY